MSKDQREIAGKLRTLQHAEVTGQAAKTYWAVALHLVEDVEAWIEEAV